MKIIPILLLFLFISQLQAQDTTRELIDGLNSDSYHTRNKSAKLLYRKVLSEKDALASVKNSLESVDFTLEQRLSLRRIVSRFYLPMHRASVPIWAMPDKLRFKDGKDVSLEYYQKAQLESHDKLRGIYNHNSVMRTATKLYILDHLESFDDRQEIQTLLVVMNKNWLEEQKMMAELIEMQCYYGGNIHKSKTPPSRKVRLANQTKDESAEDRIKRLVSDHDAYFMYYCD